MNSLSILGVGQCISTIFSLQHVLVLGGNLDRDSFKICVEQRKQVRVLDACQLRSEFLDSDVSYPELVAVFAGQNPLTSGMRQVVPDSGNIDKHAAFRIDPSCVNLVKCIGLLPIDIVGVDLEQVVSSVFVSRCLVVEH